VAARNPPRRRSRARNRRRRRACPRATAVRSRRRRAPTGVARSPRLHARTQVAEAPLIDPRQALRAARADRSRASARIPRRAWRGRRPVGPRSPSGSSRASTFRCSRSRRSGATRAWGLHPEDLVSDGFFRFELAQAVRSESEMAAARLRAPRECPGRREGAPAGRNLGFNSQAPADRLRRAACLYGLTTLRARDRGGAELGRRPRTCKRRRKARLSRPGSPSGPDSPPRQQTAQALIELEEVAREGARRAGDPGGEHSARPPTRGDTIQVTEFSELPPPADLQDSVEKTIDRALGEATATSSPRSRRFAPPRPRSTGARSLLADAVARRRCRLDSGQGADHRRRAVDGMVRATQPSYGIGLALEGRSSTAERASAGSSWPSRRVGPPRMRSRRRATVPSARCGKKAYTDVKLAFQRLDVAAALVDASQQAYEDSLKSYGVGARHAHRSPRRPDGS
jgi:hypothetical protein